MFIHDVSKQAVYLLVENTEVRDSPNWTITVNMRDEFVFVLHVALSASLNHELVGSVNN